VKNKGKWLADDFITSRLWVSKYDTESTNATVADELWNTYSHHFASLDAALDLLEPFLTRGRNK
jgi:hypothetical protein